MKIIIDMNLSPEWAQEFKLPGIEAVHRSQIGQFDAPDSPMRGLPNSYFRPETVVANYLHSTPKAQTSESKGKLVI